MLINKQIKTSPQWSTIFKTGDRISHHFEGLRHIFKTFHEAYTIFCGLFLLLNNDVHIKDVCMYDSQKPLLKDKTDHSVSLRWNKKFWTFPKRQVFFLFCIWLICELVPPSFATRLYSVSSKYGWFFSCPHVFPLQKQLYPSLQSKNHTASACEWTNLYAASLLEKRTTSIIFLRC